MQIHGNALESRCKDSNFSVKLVYKHTILNKYLEIMHTYNKKIGKLHVLKFPIIHYSAKSFLILCTVDTPFPVSVAIILML